MIINVAYYTKETFLKLNSNATEEEWEFKFGSMERFMDLIIESGMLDEIPDDILVEGFRLCIIDSEFLNWSEFNKYESISEKVQYYLAKNKVENWSKLWKKHNLGSSVCETFIPIIKIGVNNGVAYTIEPESIDIKPSGLNRYIEENLENQLHSNLYKIEKNWSIR